MLKTQLIEFNSLISQEEGGREGREVGMGGKSKNAISITATYFGSIEAFACTCTHTVHCEIKMPNHMGNSVYEKSFVKISSYSLRVFSKLFPYGMRGHDQE